ERRFRIGRFPTNELAGPSCRTGRAAARAGGKLPREPTMIKRLSPLILALALLFGAGGAPPAALAQGKNGTAVAAASTKNALDDIDAAFSRSTGIKVLASYAASSALIKQIENGAPADVFASADLDWMDYGAQKKLIKDDSRINLLGNRLVLIAPKDSKIGD